MSNYGQYVVPKATEMVNLGVGQPRNEILKRPLEYTQKYLSELSKEEITPDVLQYGDIPGYYRFRKALSNYLNTKSYSSNPEDFFQTNGVTEAVSLITLLLTNKEDLLVVEDPTYFLMINIFKELGRPVEAVRIRPYGVDIRELEDILKKNTHRKVMFYSIPFNHNPTGFNYEELTKKELVNLLDTYPNFYMMTDEVYQLLDFKDTVPPKPMAEYHNRIITMGSFSKVIAPAFRIGWIYTKNENLMKQLKNSASRDSSGGNNVMSSLVVEKMLNNGDVDILLKQEKERLGENLEYIEERISTRLSRYVDNYHPKGGYFVWFRLKDEYHDMKEEIFNQMEKFKVKFHNGSKFSLVKNWDFCFRISLSFYEKEEIALGIDRIGDLLDHLFSRPKIFIHGEKGRLGSLIKNEINQSSYELVLSLEEATHVIDVTSKMGTVELLEKIIELGINPTVIVGTTGHTNFKMFEDYRGKIFYLSNFSNGIRKMKEFIKLLDNMDYKVSIEETHHIHKKDAPSGTALSLADEFKTKNVRISSKREGEVFGEHKIILENEYERIEICHSAKNRELFAKGCVDFIKETEKYSNGFYSI